MNPETIFFFPGQLKLNHLTCSSCPLHQCGSARSGRRPRFPPDLWAGCADCIPERWSTCGWHHFPASAPQMDLQSPGFDREREEKTQEILISKSVLICRNPLLPICSPSTLCESLPSRSSDAGAPSNRHPWSSCHNRPVEKIRLLALHFLQLQSTLACYECTHSLWSSFVIPPLHSHLAASPRERKRGYK